MVRSFRRAAENGTPAACAPRAAARCAFPTSEFGFNWGGASTFASSKKSLNGEPKARVSIDLTEFQRREPPGRRRSGNCIVPANPNPYSWWSAAFHAAHGETCPPSDFILDFWFTILRCNQSCAKSSKYRGCAPSRVKRGAPTAWFPQSSPEIRRRPNVAENPFIRHSEICSEICRMPEPRAPARRGASEPPQSKSFLGIKNYSRLVPRGFVLVLPL